MTKISPTDSEKNLFRSALKTSPTVVFTHDTELRYSWIYNPSAGYKADTILGKRDDELLPPVYAEPMMALKRSVLETGKGTRQVVKTINAEETHELYYDLSIEPLRDGAGYIIGVACAATDITDKKLSEQRERLQRALSDSLVTISLVLTRSIELDHNLSDVLKLVAETVPCDDYHYLILESETFRLFRGQNLEQKKDMFREEPSSLPDDGIFGKMRETQQAMRIDEEAFISESNHFNPWVRAYVGSPIIIFGETIGFINLASSQPDAFQEHHAQYLRTVADKVGLAIRNASLFRQLSTAVQQFKKADQFKNRLLSTVSHELRTPLTSIKGFTTTLLAEDVTWDEASQKRFLNNINEEVDRLNELINQLLDFSRLEAGRLPIHPQAVRIEQIITTVIERLRLTLLHHTVQIQMLDDPPHVWADQRRIEQVLANLLRNAATYSPHKSTIMITLEQPAGSETVTIKVRDQGPGIPEEEQQDIFQPFSRGGSSKNKGTGGAGLGLAISKRIIESHQGDLWIESSTENGTVFAFTLHLHTGQE